MYGTGTYMSMYSNLIQRVVVVVPVQRHTSFRGSTRLRAVSCEHEVDLMKLFRVGRALVAMLCYWKSRSIRSIRSIRSMRSLL